MLTMKRAHALVLASEAGFAGALKVLEATRAVGLRPSIHQLMSQWAATAAAGHPAAALPIVRQLLEDHCTCEASRVQVHPFLGAWLLLLLRARQGAPVEAALDEALTHAWDWYLLCTHAAVRVLLRCVRDPERASIVLEQMGTRSLENAHTLPSPDLLAVLRGEGVEGAEHLGGLSSDLVSPQVDLPDVGSPLPPGISREDLGNFASTLLQASAEEGENEDEEDTDEEGVGGAFLEMGPEAVHIMNTTAAFHSAVVDAAGAAGEAQDRVARDPKALGDLVLKASTSFLGSVEVGVGGDEAGEAARFATAALSSLNVTLLQEEAALQALTGGAGGAWGGGD